MTSLFGTIYYRLYGIKYKYLGSYTLLQSCIPLSLVQAIRPSHLLSSLDFASSSEISAIEPLNYFVSQNSWPLLTLSTQELTGSWHNTRLLCLQYEDHNLAPLTLIIKSPWWASQQDSYLQMPVQLYNIDQMTTYQIVSKELPSGWLMELDPVDTITLQITNPSPLNSLTTCGTCFITPLPFNSLAHVLPTSSHISMLMA